MLIIAIMWWSRIALAIPSHSPTLAPTRTPISPTSSYVPSLAPTLAPTLATADADHSRSHKWTHLRIVAALSFICLCLIIIGGVSKITTRHNPRKRHKPLPPHYKLQLPRARELLRAMSARMLPAHFDERRASKVHATTSNPAHPDKPAENIGESLHRLESGMEPSLSERARVFASSDFLNPQLDPKILPHSPRMPTADVASFSHPRLPSQITSRDEEPQTELTPETAYSTLKMRDSPATARSPASQT